MFINKYSVLAFSMILACLQAATEQDQLDIALALSKEEHEAELKRKDDIELQKAQLRSKKMYNDSMALQKAIEEQNTQKALQDDLETRSRKPAATAGHYENEDPGLQKAIAESMQKLAATAGYHENEDPELQQAIAESMQKTAATAGHYENEDPELQQAIAESMQKTAATDYSQEEMDEETRAAIELSMQTSSARTSRAPLSEADLEVRVNAQFEKEKGEIEIEIEIQELAEIDVNRTVTIVKDRPKRRNEINARLSVLRNQLQDYTIPGKITAKKMQIKRYIAAQR